MKRKIFTILTTGSVLLMVLTGCGASPDRASAGADAPSYVAVLPDGSTVEISPEEAEEIRELQEELGISEESLYEEGGEEVEEEIEEEGVKEPFNINRELGNTEKGTVTILGVKYAIYAHGAEITEFENEYAVLQEEVEYKGVTYPVISFSGRPDNYSDTFEIPPYIRIINSYKTDQESIIIPETVEYINGGFYGGFSGEFKNITFLGEPETTSCWDRTFSGCSSLQTAVVLEGVTDLEWTFTRCSSLASVSLPNSLKTIGEATFARCSSLTEITIPDSVTTIGHDAFARTGITHIDIPESVKELNLGAFCDCSELEELIIPDSIICNGCISGSLDALKIVKFSNNVNQKDFFYKFNAPKLELVIFPDSITDLSADLFDDVEDKSNLTIQVPAKTVEYFQNIFPEINVVAKE